MSYTIEEIRIVNFRGIRDLYLPIEGQNLIVVGENGSGKSSIIDAIEYSLKHSVDKLTGRRDVDEKNSLPFLNDDRKPTVKLSVSDPAQNVETVSVSYPYTDPKIPNNVEPFFTLAAEQNFILRRSQILRFIEAKGAARYKQVSSLIGLEHLDEIDKAWRKKRNELEREKKTVEKQYKGALREAGEELSSQLKDEQALIQAVNAELVSFALPEVNHVAELEAALEDFQQELAPHQRENEQVAELHRYQQFIDDVSTQTATVMETLDGLAEARDDYYDRLQNVQDADLEQLLVHGRKYLQMHVDRGNCPLCESEITDLPALMERLDERLERLEELTVSRQGFENELEQAAVSLTSLLDRLRSFGEFLESTSAEIQIEGIQAAVTEAETWKQAIGSKKRAAIFGVAVTSDSALTHLQDGLSSGSELVEEQINHLKSGEESQSQLDLLLRLQNVLRCWKSVHRCKRELDIKNYVLERYSLIYSGLTTARKAGIERIQRSIEQDLERFYRLLHPDDAEVTVSFPIHSTYNSIDLTASFYDQEAHPLNFYSEGHLDSLGLCIFLAFIVRYSRDLKLIVLDDVLTTIDAGHRIRVARLLAREFKDFQVIITTHDRLWAEQLRKALPASRMTRLKPWSLELGVNSQEYIPTWDYYRRQAESGRAQDAIAGTGRSFEKFLYEMRGRLGLAIRAKPDDDYTIGDMYDPFFKWVRRYRPDRPDRSEFTDEILELEERLDQVWRLRNWSGAHFNPWGEFVTEVDALSFIDEIEMLTRSFECPKCRTLVTYNVRIGVLHCPNCRPSPPPPIVWEYDTEWVEMATRKLDASKEAPRRGAVLESQKALLRFLRDARRLYGFSVIAKPDDQYEIDDLYTPFLEWARSKSLPTMEEEFSLEPVIGKIGAYIKEGEWKPVPDNDREAFVNAVAKLTSIFHCPHNDCGRLFAFDSDEESFVCPREDETLVQTEPQGALWYVKQD